MNMEDNVNEVEARNLKTTRLSYFFYRDTGLSFRLPYGRLSREVQHKLL
jgi:hypothetical protein